MVRERQRPLPNLGAHEMQYQTKEKDTETKLPKWCLFPHHYYAERAFSVWNETGFEHSIEVLKRVRSFLTPDKWTKKNIYTTKDGTFSWRPDNIARFSFKAAVNYVQSYYEERKGERRFTSPHFRPCLEELQQRWRFINCTEFYHEEDQDIYGSYDRLVDAMDWMMKVLERGPRYSAPLPDEYWDCPQYYDNGGHVSVYVEPDVVAPKFRKRWEAAPRCRYRTHAEMHAGKPYWLPVKGTKDDHAKIIAAHMPQTPWHFHPIPPLSLSAPKSTLVKLPTTKEPRVRVRQRVAVATRTRVRQRSLLD